MKKNPISIMTFVFNSDLNSGRIAIDKLIEGLRKIGYDGVEIFQADLARDHQSEGRYRQAIKAAGMKLACLDIICDLVSKDAGERKKSMDLIRAGIDLAREYGCDQGMVVGSSSKPGITAAEARRMIADGIASQLEYARQAGVTLMIEDFGMDPAIQCRAVDCLEVLNKAGKGVVKFTYDTGNFIFSGEDTAVNLPKFLSLINHVHFKSWRREADRQPGDSGVIAGYIGCPIAEGVIPNQALLQKILASGYRRWLSIECGAMGEPLATAARDFSALKKWL